jgi:hypothetical protein
VSTRVRQHAGMVVVHKLLYIKYKVNNKVVFQNTPTRGPAQVVMAAQLQDMQPYIQPLKNCQYYKSGGVELLNVCDAAQCSTFISSSPKTIINKFSFFFVLLFTHSSNYNN